MYLISQYVENGLDPATAMCTVLPSLRGAFGLAFASGRYPDLLIGGRFGSPLVMAIAKEGRAEMLLDSDAFALDSLTPPHRLYRRRRLVGDPPRIGRNL